MGTIFNVEKEKTFCPALNGYVYFTLKGWNHIIGQFNYKKRNTNDVYRRLVLLPYIKSILEKTQNVSHITKKFGKVFYSIEEYIEIDSTVKVKVRIILLRNINEKYIFYSLIPKP